jgi:CRP-like cAMP-binding protein
MAGTCRQTINIIFKEFERTGLIRFDERKLVICNALALSELTL